MLDAITEAPAIIRNNYFDYLAANPEAAAEFDPGMAQYSQLESRGFATSKTEEKTPEMEPAAMAATRTDRMER